MGWTWHGKKSSECSFTMGLFSSALAFWQERKMPRQSKEHEGHCGTKPSRIHLDQVNFNYLQIHEQDAH